MSESANITHASEATFDALVVERSRELPVLVDFWAAWCGPCRNLMPLLERAVDSYGGKVALVKVDTDAEQGLAARFGVRSLPTVKLFRYGEVMDEFLGAQPEAAIHALLAPWVVRESDAALDEAAGHAERGDFAQAIEVLEAALAADPDNHRLLPALAEVQLAAGEPELAEAVLRRLPANADIDVDALKARIRLASAGADGAATASDLRAQVDEQPDDIELRFALGTRLAAEGAHEDALGELLEVVKADRAFRDGAARKAMVDIFASLGNEGPVVSRFRSQLARSLY